ncbi:FtsX-like permease family protein [Nocardioides sp. zg-1308]|uniref:FtsX-like permease family protein n=1 Tax=Nocardioides sp. zg-1308 TaxID=2736253 RepID=UPI0034641578
MRTPRLHVATLRGRWRADRGLLLLAGLVVALTTALTAAVAPLAERTADRAMAATVGDAGSRSAVVATMPEWYDDPRGKTRDPTTAVQVRQDADYADQALPPEMASVLRPGVTTIITPDLQLLDAGPGRFLELVHLDTPAGPPAVSWTRGGPPRASVGPRRADAAVDAGAGPWTVQVAVSETVADALGLQAGDRLPARDEQGREVRIRVSGTFAPADEDDGVWGLAPRLLQPAQGRSDGVPFTSASALVSTASLPDLRLGLPADDLTHRVVFGPEPERVRWDRSAALGRSVVGLQSSAGLARGDISWDSLLGGVLDDGRAQVASARGQAQVLLVGLVTCALLVLVLAAQLLVRRRAGPIAMARQRGAAVVDVAGELLVEAVVVAVLAAAAGLGVVVLLTGSAGWGWAVAVVLAAASAAPVLGAFAAVRAAGGRRAPANRAARRTAARAVRLRRLAVEAAVLVVAATSYVALRQRGVVGVDGTDGDLTAAGAPTWWALAVAVVLLRLLPPVLRRAVHAARRSSGGSLFVVAARLTETGSRALPVLVTTVAVTLTTLGAALAATEREGQAEAALAAVGGDARLDATPTAALDEVARRLSDAPGVRAAVAARVEDGVQVSSRGLTETVRVVVVDAAAYQRLLERSDLPDAPDLARLGTAPDGTLPALLLGDDALRDDPVLRWEGASVPFDVVGTAPDVGASVDPVLVVDRDDLADAGVGAAPGTVWAVGPGAEGALRAVDTGSIPVDTVVGLDDELDRRRDAPLPSALLRLAVVASLLVLALAALGAVLAAAAEAPARAESLGRLRALGIPDRDLSRIVAAELAVPVVVAGLVGVASGIACAYAVLASLSLERLTGQSGPPAVVVPWWTVVAVAVLVATVVVVASLEWRRLRGRPLAELLRN